MSCPCDRLCSFGRISRDSIYFYDHRAYGAVRHVHSFFPYEYNVTDARILYRKTKASTIGSSELRAPLCGSRCGEYAPRCSTVLADRAHERGGISLTQTSKPCGTRFGLDIRIQIVHTVRLTVYATPGRFRWRKRAARPGARLRSRGRTSLAARLGRGPHRTAPRCQRHRAGGGRDGRARLMINLIN